MLDTYTNLSTSIQTWGTRTYGQTQVDEFILLAESEINLRLGPDYRRETTSTITTDSDGEASLPSGFLGMRSIVQDLSGSVPLKPTSWRALTSLNPDSEASTPVWYAISGTTLKVAPIYEGDFVAAWWEKLTGLGANNASNWLLAAAPNVYLYYCRAAQAAFEEEFPQAAAFKAQADDALDRFVSNSIIAQYANAGLVMTGVTP